MRAVTMTPHPSTDPPQNISDSPLYLLAVLVAARRSKDRLLERITRRQLDSLGLKIIFGDELPVALDKNKGKGNCRG